MPARLRITVIGFGLAFLLSLTGWLLLGAPGLVRQAQAQDASGYAGALRPNIPVQPLDGLTDEEGKPARLGGDVTIVTFLYTNCEDSCPTTAQQIRAAIDDLKDPPPVLAISVDPVGDTRSTARKFLVDQSLVGRMRYLVGPPVALQRQWKVYGIQPQTRDDEHSLSTVLLDRTGRQRIGFPLDKLTPEGLARDVERLRAEPTT